MEAKSEMEVEAQLEAARKVAVEQILVIKEKPVEPNGNGGAGGGEVLIVPTDIIGAEAVAFRIPTEAEWRQYRIMIQSPDPQSKVLAINNLVTLCCIFPTKDNFRRIVEARPGIIETCYGDLQEHAGAGRAKKAFRL